VFGPSRRASLAERAVALDKPTDCPMLSVARRHAIA